MKTFSNKNNYGRTTIMMRRAFTMRLKSGSLAEYTRNHNEIWPGLVEEIERSGIATITTFEQDPVLFLFSEITDEAAWDRLWRFGRTVW
jgi:L-rhamnose mutarotase